ncbi:MAG: site-specific integrase [Candidatus Promineifilaceae bacterium]|nr:site-specific integrase [Candidatus Promineifilaceae bacterium]
MIEANQPALFPAGALSADSSLQAALGAFEKHLTEEGFAEYTRRAYTSDIRLLGKYLGIGQPIGEIGTKNLNDFLHWLLYERGVPCSQKSYARRVTSLKAFFGWLAESGVLASNAADAVVQISVTSPLPSLPTEREIQRALEITSALRQGSDGDQPDARPHLLLTLLLRTGIKKGETTSLVLNHVDRDAADGPMLFIRYKNPRQRHKERKIPLDHDWLEVLDEYIEQYAPADTIFTCTARNLEYILSDVAESAGLEKGALSFENLRWVSALRDYRQEVEPQEIRRKLGLSPVTWRETKNKIERLEAQQRTGDL